MASNTLPSVPYSAVRQPGRDEGRLAQEGKFLNAIQVMFKRLRHSETCRMDNSYSLAIAVIQMVPAPRVFCGGLLTLRRHRLLDGTKYALTDTRKKFLLIAGRNGV